MSTHLRSGFATLYAESLGASISRAGIVFDYLAAHYNDTARHYHNLNHISDCLTGFHASVRQVSRVEANAIELALWFHDLVYDPTLPNNEELSVAILHDFATEDHLDPICVGAASRAIMATGHKSMPKDTVDKWVVDIDLSILRSPEARFDHYERQIRAEYSFVDDAAWIAGRSKFLQGMLDREWIYSTQDFRRLYEGDARANLKRSLARLADGEVLHLSGT